MFASELKAHQERFQREQREATERERRRKAREAAAKERQHKERQERENQAQEQRLQQLERQEKAEQAAEALVSANRGVAVQQELMMLPLDQESYRKRGIRRLSDKVVLPRSMEGLLMEQQAHKNGTLHFRLDVGGVTQRSAHVAALGFTAREGTIEVHPGVLRLLLGTNADEIFGREFAGKLAVASATKAAANSDLPAQPAAELAREQSGAELGAPGRVPPSAPWCLVTYRRLPKAISAVIQPELNSFVRDIGEGAERCLEVALTRLSTLTIGQVVHVTADDVAVAAGLSPATARDLRAAGGAGTPERPAYAMDVDADAPLVDGADRMEVDAALPWGAPGGGLERATGGREPLEEVRDAALAESGRLHSAYALRVLALQPEGAASLIDTELAVEFRESVEYLAAVEMEAAKEAEAARKVRDEARRKEQEAAAYAAAAAAETKGREAAAQAAAQRLAASVEYAACHVAVDHGAALPPGLTREAAVASVAALPPSQQLGQGEGGPARQIMVRLEDGSRLRGSFHVGTPVALLYDWVLWRAGVQLPAKGFKLVRQRPAQELPDDGRIGDVEPRDGSGQPSYLYAGGPSLEQVGFSTQEILFTQKRT